MGRFLTLGGLGKIWDNIKGRLMPDISISANIDYIVETGTINNWTYQKWNNGMIELYQDYYSNKTFAQGTSGNNILLLIIKDTDNFSFTPLASFTTAGITGHNTPIVEYSRVSYSSNMDQTFSEAGYYLDTYIYCPNGPYNGVYFWLRPYVVGTWK